MSNGDLPSWLIYLVRTRQSYIQPVVLTEGYQRQLDHFYSLLEPEPSDLHGLFPVADEDQTSFIICKDDGAAIFFDVGQAAILKSAYAAMCSDDPETAVFKLFLATASLKIGRTDGFIADRLGDCWTDPYDGDSMTNPELLAAARGTLDAYRQLSAQPLFNAVIDCSILAHEMYHYRSHHDLKEQEIEDFVQHLFPKLVAVATEDTSAFPTGKLTDEKRNRYARERAAKRDFYLGNQASLAEEIACDAFALIETTNVVAEGMDPDMTLTDRFKIVIALYSIAFNLHLLHLAFTERARFYLTHDLGDEFPGNFSFYNLRRIAVSVLGGEFYAATVAKGQGRPDEAMHQASSAEMQQLLNHLYIEMSEYITMPAIPRLNGCFELIEKTYPRSSRPAAEPIADANERLALSALHMNLDQGVVQEMFEHIGRV